MQPKNDLPHQVVRAPKSSVKTVAAAESLTGGYIAQRLTAVPGASAVLEGSVVTYSDRIKEKLLGVCAQDLQQYTAVSEPVAAQMAQGVRKQIGADIGISVTGFAGPDGGGELLPVGTVFLGCADETYVTVTRLHIVPPAALSAEEQREFIRFQTTEHALQAVLKVLEKEENTLA